MHKTQLKILELSGQKDITQMGLREIGREVGVKHPQVVHYHLNELKRRGLLKKSSRTIINKLQKTLKDSVDALVNIPILGAANCGNATLFANKSIEGYLKISQKLLRSTKTDGLFALTADGDSMNLAKISGKQVNHGDYLLIDGNQSNPKDGNYVLSIIDGCANVKKFKRIGNQIALLSESTETFPPIFIHTEDNCLINGVVIDVIKRNGGDTNATR